jgi:hypothetical protein
MAKGLGFEFGTSDIEVACEENWKSVCDSE